jgi:hypothetical protein
MVVGPVRTGAEKPEHASLYVCTMPSISRINMYMTRAFYDSTFRYNLPGFIQG